MSELYKASLLLATILISGCSVVDLFLPGYEVTEEYDKFDDEYIFAMHWNKLKSKLSYGPETNPEINQRVYLNAVLTKKGEAVQIGMVAVYSGPDWIFIPRGESLVLLIDGKRLAYSSRHVGRTVISGSWVQESVVYEISREDLLMISNAQSIEVRLHNIERSFSKENILRFKDFSAKYLK